MDFQYKNSQIKKAKHPSFFFFTAIQFPFLGRRGGGLGGDVDYVVLLSAKIGKFIFFKEWKLSKKILALSSFNQEERRDFWTIEGLRNTGT